MAQNFQLFCHMDIIRTDVTSDYVTTNVTHSNVIHFTHPMDFNAVKCVTLIILWVSGFKTYAHCLGQVTDIIGFTSY